MRHLRNNGLMIAARVMPSSNPDLPFGYAFNDSILDHHPDEAPQPARGNPILSDTETSYLDSFLHDVSSIGGHNFSSFGEGYHFTDSLIAKNSFLPSPTTFSGTHSVPFNIPLGQAVVPHDCQHVPPPFVYTNYDVLCSPPQPPMPSWEPQAQEQHMHKFPNAAAAPCPNGAGSHNSEAHDRLQPRRPVDYGFARHQPMGEPLYHSGACPQPPEANDHHVQPARRSLHYNLPRYQPMEEFRAENHRSSLSADHRTSFKEWMSGRKACSPPRQPPLSDYQWGSDSSFSPAHVHPPQSTRDRLRTMPHARLNPVNGHGANGLHDRPMLALHCEPDTNTPPRKRRKSANVKDATADHDDGKNGNGDGDGDGDSDGNVNGNGDGNVNGNGDDDDDVEPGQIKSSKQRQPKLETNATQQVDAPASNGKRRKSTTSGGVKPPRENLSEDQKRENHIKSEQKRRLLIQNGFNDLAELVPNVKNGGFSKSTILTMAADWLEKLIRENEALLARTGRKGVVDEV